MLQFVSLQRSLANIIYEVAQQILGHYSNYIIIICIIIDDDNYSSNNNNNMLLDITTD